MPSSPESTDAEPVRSPRHARSQRKNLAGLDFDPEEGDEEYNEDADESVVKDEDGDEIDDDDDDDVDPADVDDDDLIPPPKKRRGRKRKATNELPEDLDDDEEPALDAGEKEAEKNDDPAVKAETGEPEEPVVRKKKRGRKPKIPRPDDIFYDDKGNEINVQNDEIVLDNEDPKGLEKIDKLGFLQGERKFRVKTFTVFGKGERQYMVSTEPARLVGFRDSYLLFKTHLSLFKKVCTNEEKMDLIRRHLIPTSYKGRAVNLVTARSIYREFGARMIVDGKKVTDDFWEEQARERGDVEGEPAEVEEFVAKGPTLAPGDINQFQAQVTGSALIQYQTDPTWMYQVALQTSEYNKGLTELRSLVWARGVKDNYSGFNFFPSASQPTQSKIIKVAESSNGKTLDCSLRFYNPDMHRKVTGLADVSLDLINEIEDKEIRDAILLQQKYENSVAHLK
ncbi:hypothetical protein PUMCH_003256 [Australozyma saopauloensis]|uniref:Uncharacterized protein n=1 Tax=Australozyma saopauloensis TaxID=291208 RepID=A0AAX4HBI4_9ASCO|nr:hypothetical protein PUMCH_003256 [[Candida] saopauloensis]